MYLDLLTSVLCNTTLTLLATDMQGAIARLVLPK